jgi:hypothetical protein
MEATLRVGLPGWLIAGRQKSWATALDVTALVEEWTLALLDPVDALRRAAPEALRLPGWELAGKATVNATTMRVVRDAAADPDVQALIEEAIGPGKLTLQGSCLLLGLAAVTALDANIGKASALMLSDVKKRQVAKEGAAAKREHQRSAHAAALSEMEKPTVAALAEPASTKAGAERPVLTEMPPDAWGTAVR